MEVPPRSHLLPTVADIHSGPSADLAPDICPAAGRLRGQLLRRLLLRRAGSHGQAASDARADVCRNAMPPVPRHPQPVLPRKISARARPLSGRNGSAEKFARQTRGRGRCDRQQRLPAEEFPQRPHARRDFVAAMRPLLTPLQLFPPARGDVRARASGARDGHRGQRARRCVPRGVSKLAAPTVRARRRRRSCWRSDKRRGVTCTGTRQRRTLRKPSRRAIKQSRTGERPARRRERRHGRNGEHGRRGPPGRRLLLGGRAVLFGVLRFRSGPTPTPSDGDAIATTIPDLHPARRAGVVCGRECGKSRRTATRRPPS